MHRFTKRLVAVAAVALAGIWMGGVGDYGAHAVIGHGAPDFTLTDTEGNTHTLSEYTKAGKIVVLEWYNPMCPFVVRHHDEHTTMNDLYNEFNEKDVVFLAVNSAHEKHPTYGKDAKSIKKWGKLAPVMIDSSGKIGRMYGAKTTPQMYIINAEGTLVYNGAIDDDRPNSKPAESKTNFVRQALNEIIAGEAVTVSETKPYGCSVKYAKK